MCVYRRRLFVCQIFDKFVPCVKDSNSKVNLQALQVMVELIPVLKDYFNNVATFTIQTITANLSSKNRDINDAAVLALDALMEHLGKDHNIRAGIHSRSEYCTIQYLVHGLT